LRVFAKIGDGKWLNPAGDDLRENVRKKRCHNGTLTKQR
jgi:hypothetical protein